MLSRAAPILLRSIRHKSQHVKLPQNNAHLHFTDFNSHVKREVLFRTKTKDRKDVTYELAAAEDDDLVKRFLRTFFMKNESLSVTAGLDDLDGKAVVDIYAPIISYSILAKIEGEIVGITCFCMEEHKKQTEKPVWPADFGKMNDAGPTKRRRTNVVINFVNECEKSIYHHVPAPSTLAHASLLTVHPAHRGQGIGYVLDVGGYKVAHDRGADYIINTMSSVATNNMAMSLPGQKLIQTFEYASCLDYGKRPFEKMIDGATTSGVYMLDLKKYWPTYEKLLNDTIKRLS